MATMSAQEALVPGGHLRNPKSPTSFDTTAMPVIYDDQIIIAVTPVTLRNATPTLDFWFLCDFYGFNVMFKGATPKGRQVWLTCINTQDVITRIKDKAGDIVTELVHGNGENVRKTVLNQQLIDDNKVQDVVVVRSADMTERFLSDAEAASDEAVAKNVPLTLMVFCHGLRNHSLLLDDGNKRRGLRIERLKARLNPKVRLTLITTACFSGGWTVYPDFTATVIAAADDIHPSYSNRKSLSVNKYSGLVMASCIFEIMSSEASALLPYDPDVSEEDRQDQLEDAVARLNLAADNRSLQPDDPSVLQTFSFNSFSNSIVRKVTDVGGVASRNFFNFAAERDFYQHSWTGRTGIPMHFFAERWNSLPDYQPQPAKPWKGRTAEDMAGLIAPDPFREGGMAAGSEEEITMEVAQNLSLAFLQTMPNGWEASNMMGLADLLDRCIIGQLDSDYGETADYVFQAIVFRWSYMNLVDEIVEERQLPVPLNQTCGAWDQTAWNADISSRQPNWSKLDVVYSTFLVQTGCLLNPHESQYPDEFYFPVSYLSAALIEGQYSDNQIDELVAAISASITKAARKVHAEVLEDRTIVERGITWLKSIGKKIRTLPSRVSSKKEKRTSKDIVYSAINQADSTDELEPVRNTVVGGMAAAEALSTTEVGGSSAAKAPSTTVAGELAAAKVPSVTSWQDSAYEASVRSAPHLAEESIPESAEGVEKGS